VVCPREPPSRACPRSLPRASSLRPRARRVALPPPLLSSRVLKAALAASLVMRRRPSGKLRWYRFTQLYLSPARRVLYLTLLTRPRMGELEPWIDENFIRSVWFGMGENVNVKMIRDKFSG
jgi:hypothetical protein